MGFRSVFITESWGSILWPDWFLEKYALWVNDDKKGLIASRGEEKAPGKWFDLPGDIQKALNWGGLDTPHRLVLIFLHECGGITRCQISKGAILWSEPDGWRKTSGIEHSYCYNCSDHPETEDLPSLFARQMRYG